MAHQAPSLVLGLAVLAGCSGGGSGSETPRPVELGSIVPFASAEQQASFARGRALALKRFTRTEGHGPEFNVDSCAACHEKPVTGGGAGRYRNFLLVARRDPATGAFRFTGINGIQTQFTREPGSRSPSDPETTIIATRNPIPFFGVGRLAEIPENEIASREDPEDADGDGISGRVNFDFNVGRVGRFGRKAQSATIEAFVRGPMFNHAGITTDPLPATRQAELPVPFAALELRGPLALVAGILGIGQATAQAGQPAQPTTDDDGVPDPELNEDDLFDLVSFALLMEAPQPGPKDSAALAGEHLFAAAGCDACHVPALQGPRGPVRAYTDLLLHDMGPELADGMQFGRTGTETEFRTQPLWGVAAVGPYLHDGRADTLDEAIRAHGGEAQGARDAYVALTPVERTQVNAFLRSLGGASQLTEGLIPPAIAPPPAGEFGGPLAGLSAPELERFERGRRVFDADMALGGGVGPVFNGDACRACHFDPAVGGSGPIDVNVVRHGSIDENGDFMPPDIGTIIHRHSARPDERPNDDSVASANVFELRQTPPLFGLGLVEQIPDAAIEALADPDDADGDGISGRVQRLPDGRLGRFGWKAQVPSLAEFARDASSAELGLTVPDQQGLTFGATSDADATADPELPPGALDDLVFFMAQLGPPPVRSMNPALEAEGAAAFDRLGCGSCHVPSLPTVSGVTVPLFSDLLLHDVRADGDDNGIEDGVAGMREFRTPPLWGLAASAPYMHDGRSATIGEAIERHAGEAAPSHAAYGQLDPAERDALIAFLRSL